MIDIIDKTACCGCGACAGICPIGCIVMNADKDGVPYPAVRKSACTDCGRCEAVCPMLHTVEASDARLPAAYAAVSRDEATRLRSSSGGVFSLLAAAVIDSGGSVFGAAFDADFRSVSHREITSKEEIGMLAGAKYVQSNTGGVFESIRGLLKQDRTVLFVGTPCQTAALQSFLGGDHDRLYTVDFVCHGVPSPGVWRDYAAVREKKAGGSIRSVSFRDKSSGWKTYSVRMEFTGGKAYKKPSSEDLYMNGYLKDLFLRPSCYDCPFKADNRAADMTLGDLWGIEKIAPELDDAKGTSLVIVRTKKGEDLLSWISGSIVQKEIPLDAAAASNPSLIRSAARPPGREAFLDKAGREGTEAALNAFCRPSASKRMKHLLKRIIK